MCSHFAANKNHATSDEPPLFPKGIYIAWTAFQRRQESMAPHCRFETVYMPVQRRQGRLAKAATYLRHGWATLKLLRSQRPAVVWVQLPQVPLMWIALLHQRLFAPDSIIVADCHNAMFRPPWSKVPYGLSLLSRCNVVLVHNSDIREEAVRLGIAPQRLLVVEDPPAHFGLNSPTATNLRADRPWLVFPASFAEDEPIKELVTAAERSIPVSILITGNIHESRYSTLPALAPRNVRFLGYLERSEFEGLIANCDGVIAFTRHDGIQLSACGEAVGAGKPMLISNTATLRRLFPIGTVFVDSQDSASIAKGINDFVSNKAALTEEMLSLRRSFIDNWTTTRLISLHNRLLGRS